MDKRPKTPDIVDEAIKEAVGSDAWMDWTIWEAAHDPKILAVFELFAKHCFAQATKEYIQDSLEANLQEQYNMACRRNAARKFFGTPSG